MLAVRLAALAAVVIPLFFHPGPAAAAEPPFHELWRQGGGLGFSGWTLSGVRLVDQQLILAAPPEVDADESGLRRGTALGPVVESTKPFSELIPSWNAMTPPGTWLELRLRARLEGRWSAWYRMGVWSSEGEANRHSIADQADGDARVLTDTLALLRPAQAYQFAVELVSAEPSASPRVSLAAVLASRSSAEPRPESGALAARSTVLDVPARSQMTYPDGGEVWCSPTSTSMVLAYWAASLGRPELERAPPEVAAGVFDSVYRGHGNWPFNTAYAARDGLVGYVTRLSSLSQVERWISAGVPVIASLAWKPGELANAPVGSTNGHLLVIVGFTESGAVVVNDPAGDPRLGQDVRRVYRRDQFEALWLARSGGTVYLIYPATQAPPAEGAFGAW
jgi:hypothetical protein